MRCRGRWPRGRGQSTRSLASRDLPAVGVEDERERLRHRDLRGPVEIRAGVVDLRHAVLHVLVALAVVVAGRDVDQMHLARALAVLGVAGGELEHHGRELAHGEVVRRVADVVDLAARDAARIHDDLHEGRDAVVDVGERALLGAAVDELDVLAAQDVPEELRDDARAAFLRRVDRVEAGADPVERPEQRVIEALLHPVGVDHAVHELLRAGVDPARLVDRAEHELRALGIELGVAAHAVHLGGRGEDDALAMVHAVPHDRQVRLEVELEHPQRLAHVRRGRGDGDERQDRVALLDVVLDPLPVDRDVAFEEMEAAIGDQVLDAVGLHVHAVDRPVGLGEDALGQMVADEAVDAEDQDFAHGGRGVGEWNGAGMERRLSRALRAPGTGEVYGGGDLAPGARLISRPGAGRQPRGEVRAAPASDRNAPSRRRHRPRRRRSRGAAPAACPRRRNARRCARP